MKPQSKQRFRILAFLIIGIVIGASFYALCTAIIVPSFQPKLSLDQMYGKAIEDAMIAKPSEIYAGLTPIVENNTNLMWQGEPGNKSVLVVTWTHYASSYPVGESVNTTWSDTWVTAVPQIQDFFKNHVNPNVNVTLRADELLGLPPNSTDTYFVELWVNPQSLFRPTPNNEINDTVASLSFPSSATADYKQWFNNNIINSYYPPKYPWTRLGYTYDWSNSQSHIGLSEFVIKQNSIVTVKSVTPTVEYLSSNR